MELVALSILLWRIAQPLPLVALGFYAVLLAIRVRLGWTLAVVMPRPHGVTVLQEYYDLFLPVALLLCAMELALLAVFIGLFPKGVLRVWRDFRQLASSLRAAARGLRARTPS